MALFYLKQIPLQEHPLNTLIDRIDHIVLTVTDIEVTTQFYEKAFGFEREFFRGPEGQPRHALLFGQLKINLQDRNTETPTKARVPTIGSGDFCLIASYHWMTLLSTSKHSKSPLMLVRFRAEVLWVRYVRFTCVILTVI
jgi:hypothetical protein